MAMRMCAASWALKQLASTSAPMQNAGGTMAIPRAWATLRASGGSPAVWTVETEAEAQSSAPERSESSSPGPLAPSSSSSELVSEASSPLPNRL